MPVEKESDEFKQIGPAEAVSKAGFAVRFEVAHVLYRDEKVSACFESEALTNPPSVLIYERSTANTVPVDADETQLTRIFENIIRAAHYLGFGIEFEEGSLPGPRTIL